MNAVNVKKKSEFARQPVGDQMLLVVGYVVLGIFVVAIIFPMIYIILSSFIDPITLQNKGVTFDFSKWTLTAYERVMTNAQIWVGFKNALLYSIEATVLSGAVTLLAAYPMSRPDFRGRGFFNVIFVITMFFGGGLIPTYLLISDIGWLDNPLAILVPGAFSVWNMIIARTYYQGIPRDLQEAANIDGASEMVYFFKILLPVCTPIIATISMWNFVGMWNSYFDAMIYLKDKTKYPLQLVLREIIVQSQVSDMTTMDSYMDRYAVSQTVKYATIMVATIPILCVYPFLQKYFVKGVMIGAIKG